jgi:isopropylmalate/homocitrate/citramalate synthase
MSQALSELVYDWNQAERSTLLPTAPVEITDETLRDGLQSPSVRDPSTADKIEILHLMAALGIKSADLGLPGAGPQARKDVEKLAREILDHKLNIRANCAARTVEADIKPIAEAADKTGLDIEAAMFLGSSQIRRYTEGWSVDFLLKTTERAVGYGVSLGRPVTFVTEDTTRTDPETVKRIYRTAIDCGARAVVITDTVGQATPEGAARLTRFMREEVIGKDVVRLEWHGHRDRGMGLVSALAAAAAGADTIHGTALGIGERCGNTETELMLVNLKLLGCIRRDLSRLKEYCETVSRAVGMPIPATHPVVGSDAFRTATGVHAAAIIKAFHKNDPGLADAVYSSVPAREFGCEQIIEVGPMSGHSNIQYWCEKQGIPFSKEIGERVFLLAKSTNRVLTREEILKAIGN